MGHESTKSRLWIWLPDVVKRALRAVVPQSSQSYLPSVNAQHDANSSLLTATAIGDPVIVLMRRRRALGVLLAADVTYAHNDLVQLHDVRWIRRPRGFMGRLPGLRPKCMDRHLAEVDLCRAGNEYVAAVPGLAQALTMPHAEPFHLTNLSAGQYEDLLHLPPRKLRRAAVKLCGTIRSDSAQRHGLSRVLHALKLAA